MKRITVTLPDHIVRHAEDWSEQTERPTANLLAYLIEKAIDDAMEAGKYQPREEFESTKGVKLKSQKSDATLKQIGRALTALADGKPLPRDVCISELASVLGIDPDTLTKLWKRTNGNSKTH